MPRVRTKSAYQIFRQSERLYNANSRNFFNGISDIDRGARILNTRDRYIRNIANIPRINRLVNIANDLRVDYATASRANERSLNAQIPRDTYMGISRGATAG